MRRIYLGVFALCCLWLGVNAQITISEQNFNGLSDTGTSTTDEVTTGMPLTNAGSMNASGTGLETFTTFWFDTRGTTDGPRDGAENGDFIGVNSFAGSNSPDVAPDGTTVASGSEHNFEFNDGDGELRLVFGALDLSGYTNRTLDLAYWIAATGFEPEDRFRVFVGDGTTNIAVLDLGDMGLELSGSVDDGTANWRSLNVNLDNTISINSLNDANIIISVWVDNNAGDENIFIDDLKIEGEEVVDADCSELAFINEFHYDNVGTDVNEFVEVAVSTDYEGALSDLAVVLYNGSNGTSYDTKTLDQFTEGSTADGFTFYYYDYPSNGIQNGPPDGIALICGESVNEFISYEGSFTATNGPANGETSTDIGVSEPGEALETASLQLIDGEFEETDCNTKGEENDAEADCEEEEVDCAELAFINEFHYDNASTDVNEFVEVAVSTDYEGALSDLAVVLYNGSNGTAYDTKTLDQFTEGSTADGFTFYYYDYPSNGIQNGPDGIALICGESVNEFISYEGSFTATNGPANGETSTDIGVSEPGEALETASLQLIDGEFEETDCNTKGEENDAEADCEEEEVDCAELAFINEFHYDNASTDVNEFVEIAVSTDYEGDLSDLAVVLYNGSNGQEYDTKTLDQFTEGSTVDGFTHYFYDYPENGIQNGPDGIALICVESVNEFISYEGSFTATDGPANGETSTDVGVSEGSGSLETASLQLIDGVWVETDCNTKGELNDAEADCSNCAELAFINEFHYDNVGTDVNEFVEVAVSTDYEGDLSDLAVVLYNGSNGTAYDTKTLDQFTEGSTVDGFTHYFYDYPVNGIQNGPPDGIALICGESVNEFISYEGSFTATDGPANGETSTDIGASESSGSLETASLQLIDGVWVETNCNTKGEENMNVAPPSDEFRTAGTFVTFPFEANLDYDDDHSICPGATATYGTAQGMSNFYDWEWTISGGGTILMGENARNVMVEWTELGTHTLTFVVTDEATGCTSTNSLEVTVEDNEAPVIECEDITVYIDENGEYTMANDEALISITDNCDSFNGPFTVGGPTNRMFDCDDAGTTYERTMVSTDQADNTGECTYNVTILDDLAPVIECEDITVYLDENGDYVMANDEALVGEITDNCGFNGPFTQGGPNARTFDCEDANETYQRTMVSTDPSGNTGSCTYSVTILDDMPPVIECQDITINFNGEEVIALETSDIIVSATDNCEISQVLDLTELSCEDLGEVLSVTATVTDQGENTVTCTQTVTVDGLPCGWMTFEDHVNCPGSDADYEVDTETFSVTALNCDHNPFAAVDEYGYVKTVICGDGEIIAQVTSLDGLGKAWAGISMRESNAAGSKKFQIMTGLDQLPHRVDYRSATNALSSTQNFSRPGQHWLRIVRNGSTFTAYTSFDGVNWGIPVNTQFISMPDCIEFGLIVLNQPFATNITATFNNVQVNGEGPEPEMEERPDVADTRNPWASVEVYPNPTSGQLTVNLGAFIDTEATLEVVDMNGRRVIERRLGVIENAIEQLDLTGEPAGVYLVRLRTQDGQTQMQRVVLQPRP